MQIHKIQDSTNFGIKKLRCRKPGEKSVGNLTFLEINPKNVKAINKGMKNVNFTIKRHQRRAWKKANEIIINV